MNTPDPSQRISEFLEMWVQGFSHVLTQVGVASPVVELLDAAAGAEALAAIGEKGFPARFAGGGCLRGHLALVTTEPEALQLGQALMSEPADRSVEFNETYRDAAAELLRQTAGQVATLWKSKASGDVQMNFVGGEPPAADASVAGGLRISAEKFPAVTMLVRVSGDFVESLQPTGEDLAPETEVLAPQREPNMAGATPAGSNLDLLLDVQLEATIRFGQRQLLLRDVLTMTPGTVVELDRQIHEPAELLVAGRVVARGEVVVVDGSFGLRITDLAGPRQRVELLQS